MKKGKEMKKEIEQAQMCECEECGPESCGCEGDCGCCGPVEACAMHYCRKCGPVIAIFGLLFLLEGLGYLPLMVDGWAIVGIMLIVAGILAMIKK